jgi:hypothetical protein
MARIKGLAEGRLSDGVRLFRVAAIAISGLLAVPFRLFP